MHQCNKVYKSTQCLRGFQLLISKHIVFTPKSSCTDTSVHLNVRTPKRRGIEKKKKNSTKKSYTEASYTEMSGSSRRASQTLKGTRKIRRRKKKGQYETRKQGSIRALPQFRPYQGWLEVTFSRRKQCTNAESNRCVHNHTTFSVEAQMHN